MSYFNLLKQKLELIYNITLDSQKVEYMVYTNNITNLSIICYKGYDELYNVILNIHNILIIFSLRIKHVQIDPRSISCRN